MAGEQDATAVACQFCGAAPGQPCYPRGRYGDREWRRTAKPHRMRVKRWEEQQETSAPQGAAERGDQNG
jgi:hypothetical protein